MNFEPTRRSFLGGAAALIAAPAIVRIASLMPVKVLKPTRIFNVGLNQRSIYRWVAPPGSELVCPTKGKLYDFWLDPTSPDDGFREFSIARLPNGTLRPSSLTGLTACWERGGKRFIEIAGDHAIPLEAFPIDLAEEA